MADDLRSLNHEFYATAERHRNRVAFVRSDAETDDPTTFGEVAARAERFAVGLRRLGLEARGRVALIADNNLRWFIADRGTLLARGIDVPQPCDIVPSTLQHVLCHSGASIAIVEGSDNRGRIQGWAAEGKLPRLKRIIRFEDSSDAPEGPIPEIPFAEVERADEDERRALRATAFAVDRNSIATIVYTSGTTGDAKGVVLTHGNILHNIRVIPSLLEVSADDRYLSVLPSWHMFERTLEYTLLSRGASVVYTSKRRLRRDLSVARPTLAAFVPRILEMMHNDLARNVECATGLQGVLARLATRVALRRHAAILHARALSDATVGGRRPWRRAFAAAGAVALALPHGALDRLVHRKVRAALGATLRVTVSGGGALPRHVDDLMNAIGFTVVVGYGLTETAPVVSVRTPRRNPVGTIGTPLPETEVTIRHQAGVDRPGVIAIRGPQVMRGYFRNRALTDQVIDAEGWFDSGDLGTQRVDGELRITGRAKDTIVLRSGENVEPEPIETSVLASPLIQQVVIVGQDQKELAALVVADPESIAPGTDVDATVQAEVRRRSGPAAGFRAFETVRRVHLLGTPFAIEDGTLTHTLKLKRNVIAERYAQEIAGLFA